jgi:hypothetical protein
MSPFAGPMSGKTVKPMLKKSAPLMCAQQFSTARVEPIQGT